MSGPHFAGTRHTRRTGAGEPPAHPQQLLAGPYQGMLLRFISQMIRPRRIPEVGTYTGYSTICLADGLPAHGQLHTIESSDELGALIRQYLLKANVAEKVQLHLGDATATIPTLTDTFDLVFPDAGKLDYAWHYELALAKTRPDGFLLADNVR